jgi:hypothetical protein
MSKLSENIAMKMDSLMKSAEHKNLFGQTVKFVKAKHDHNHDHDEDMQDVDDQNCGDTMMANDTNMDMDSDDMDHADDNKSEVDNLLSDEYNVNSLTKSEKKEACMDLAVEGLLMASAALDELGVNYGSHLTLKLASMVAEAKKEELEKNNEKTKEKMKKEKAKAKSKPLNKKNIKKKSR